MGRKERDMASDGLPGTGVGLASRGSASTGILVLLLIAAAGAVVVPRLRRTSCHGGNSTAAIATLRNLVSVQEKFRESRAIDLDGDGKGEYGTFLEMTGTVGLRADASGVRRGPVLVPAVLSPSLASVNGVGVVSKAGYAFAIFLPGKDGAWVRETWSYTPPPGRG